MSINIFFSDYPGTLQDQMMALLADNGFGQGTVNDRWLAFLKDKGHVGTYDDATRAFLLSYLGLTDSGQSVNDLWGQVDAPYSGGSVGPIDRENLIEEWNADDLLGVYINGENVQLWPGRYNGIDMVPRVADNFPLYWESVGGGISGVQFAGKLLNTADIQLPVELTVYCLARNNSVATTQSFVTQDSGNTTADRSWHLKTTATTKTSFSSFVGSSGNTDTEGTEPVTVGTWNVHAGARDLTSAQAYFEGVGGAPLAIGTSNVVTKPISLGGRGVGTEYLDGYIHSVRIYTGRHDAATIAAVVAEMKA